MKKVLALVLSLVIVISGLTTTLFSGVSATVSGNDVFNTSANWVVYAFDTTHFNGENGTAGPSFASISENTNTAYTCDDESSLKIGSKVQYATVEFDVEQNKYYELSYKFLANGTPYTSTSTGKSAYLWSTGVTTSDANITGGKNYYAHMSTTANYTAENGVYAERVNGTEYTDQWITAGIWNTVTLKFNSGSATKMVLAIQPGADSFYVDDFTLTVTEKTDGGSSEPGTDKTPKESVVIDFDTYGGNAVQTSPRVKIEDCTAYNGSTSKMLHFIGGDYSSSYPTNLNYSTIMASGAQDTDDVFTVGVKPNTKYTLSFRSKVSDSTKFDATYLKAFFTYKGVVKKDFVLTKDVKGAWVEHTVEYTTEADQNLLSFYMNLSEVHVDVWVDDITIAEKKDTPDPDAVPVIPGKEPKDETVINFDTPETGANASLSPSSRIEIAEGTAYDGSTSKMLHFIGGDYSSSYPTNLNYSTIMASGAQDTDDVFTVGVKPNTKYTLSFRSKVSDSTKFDATYLKAFFTYKGVVKKDFVLTKDVKGAWVEHTVEYTTEADQNLLSFYMNLSEVHVDVWVDDITIAEKKDTPDPDPTPGTDPNATYDDAAAWGFYNARGAATLNGAGTQTYSWGSITDNTDKTYTYNNGEKSVKYRGNGFFMATKLKDLVKDKAYKITFKYFAPTTSEMSTWSKAWCSELGIYAGGTAMNGDIPTSAIKKGNNIAGESGKWNEFSMSFKADSTDLYFGIHCGFAKGYVLYIDEFTVEETTEDPDAVPVIPGKEPKDETVINFDTPETGANASLTPSSRIEIAEGTAYDGSKSKMLHFKKGQYTSDTTLNYGTGYQSDSDAVFTVGVKPNSVYKLTYRIKIDSNKEFTPEWLGFYATYNKKTLARANFHSGSKFDEWLLYEFTLTTGASQNLLSFYANMGKNTPDIWIDDITLTKTDMTPFNGWGDTPKEEYNINFDDFDVVYDNSAIEIIDGPAKEDGSVSKATHIKAGSYKNAVFSNWSTVTTGKDKVFTIPVKPNTLYEFGYSLYTDEKEGRIAYFTFFYDYENTLVLGASGDATKKQWVHRNVRFVTKPDQTQISIGFNAGETVLNLYLDDIYLKEILPGTVGYANDLSYCENPYNIVKQQGLQKKVTSGKSAVIKLPVKEQTMYTFGITVNSSKMSNSKIFLSTDGVTPMAKSMDNAPTAIISADGKSGRYGINFVSDNTGYVYLVIQNDDGALTLKDPMLFNTVSISTELPIGRKTMQKTELSVNKNVKLENIKLLGEEGSSGGGTETANNDNSADSGSDYTDTENYGDNPLTGSETVLPAVMLFITLALALIVLAKFKKGGEQA